MPIINSGALRRGLGLSITTTKIDKLTTQVSHMTVNKVINSPLTPETAQRKQDLKTLGANIKWATSYSNENNKTKKTLIDTLQTSYQKKIEPKYSIPRATTQRPGNDVLSQFSQREFSISSDGYSHTSREAQNPNSSRYRPPSPAPSNHSTQSDPSSQQSRYSQARPLNIRPQSAPPSPLQASFRPQAQRSPSNATSPQNQAFHQSSEDRVQRNQPKILPDGSSIKQDGLSIEVELNRSVQFYNTIKPNNEAEFKFDKRVPIFRFESPSLKSSLKDTSQVSSGTKKNVTFYPTPLKYEYEPEPLTDEELNDKFNNVEETSDHHDNVVNGEITTTQKNKTKLDEPDPEKREKSETNTSTLKIPRAKLR